jgi:uncharacterized membrane protein YhiD involved in acid resistance
MSMTLHDFFKELNYSLNEETSNYIKNLTEVNLKLLIKRVYEDSDLIKNELNRQVKLTEFKDIQDVVKSLNKEETVKFVRWMSENIFSANQIIEEQLEKILVK